MNAKYVLALILVLQVSTNLCEAAQPSQDVVDTYNQMKATFRQRLVNAWDRLSQALQPYVDNNEGLKAIKDRIDQMQTNEEYQAVVQVLRNIVKELTPDVDHARTTVLGTYEEKVRPVIGQQVRDTIDILKKILDRFMPAN